MTPRIGSFWIKKGERPLLARDGNVFLVVELQLSRDVATLYGPIVRMTRVHGTVSFVNKRTLLPFEELECEWEECEP